jgi:hypothetical protein
VRRADEKRLRRKTKRALVKFFEEHKRWPTTDDLDSGVVREARQAYTTFPTAVKAAQQSNQARTLKKQPGSSGIGWKSTDAMWKRLPGSFEMGKRR